MYFKEDYKMKIFFRNRESEEYKEISVEELEAIKIKMDRPSSNRCSWGCEVIAMDKIDVENDIMYLQVEDFEC